MDILSARKVSELIGVPLGTLRYWRHAGIGPASFTLGRRVVYRRAKSSDGSPNRRGRLVEAVTAQREAHKKRDPGCYPGPL